ncbi:LLM class flavin-dependent oxidoreductase [Kitasatospora sp. NBC_00315]|uniref:LLM class flavin-dependent oxidoreductase n=1 Tax=Kitasatospora sp. NBC_00315 TaxID=2975963 RepID=UPI003256823C
MTIERRLHLALSLDGFGAHPAAWRRTSRTPESAFGSGDLHLDAIARAEHGLLDFVTLDDTWPLHAERPGRARGRLEAALVLAVAAARTSRIGLVPTALASRLPGEVADRIATLDHLSAGRAGWRPRVDVTPEQLALVLADQGGPFVVEAFAGADEFVQAVTGFWDSWAPGALVGDRESGRFADQELIRRTDFAGQRVRASGSAAVPRPPQGRPVTAILGHATVPYRLAARHADVAFVTPTDRDGLIAIREELEGLRKEAGRTDGDGRLFADLNVVLAGTQAAAHQRLADLDGLDGEPFSSDATTFAGTPAELADLLEDWFREGGADGFRLRPALLAEDLDAVVEGLVPELRRRGLFRTAYTADTLRGHLGLPAAERSA